jgi:hypothetical protein
MAKTYIKINLPTLKKYGEIFSSDLRFKQNQPIRDMLQRWRDYYSAFLVQRYFQYSFGGGDWAQLAESTLAYKRRHGLLLQILRATDLLFQSFAVMFDKPGAKDKEFGIKISFGGGTGVSYPGKTITPAEVGMFHQLGGPRLPKRVIIVRPDRITLAKMRNDLKATLMAMYQQST